MCYLTSQPCEPSRSLNRYAIKLGSRYFRNNIFLEMKYILLWFLDYNIWKTFCLDHASQIIMMIEMPHLWFDNFFSSWLKKKLDNVSHRFPGNYCQSAIKSITVTIWHGEFNKNCWIFWKSFLEIRNLIEGTKYFALFNYLFLWRFGKSLKTNSLTVFCILTATWQH